MSVCQQYCIHTPTDHVVVVQDPIGGLLLAHQLPQHQDGTGLGTWDECTSQLPTSLSACPDKALRPSGESSYLLQPSLSFKTTRRVQLSPTAQHVLKQATICA